MNRQPSDSTPTTDWTFKAERGCVFCHRFFEYPLADEAEWTAVPIGDSRDEYWRCPRCTAEGRERPA